MNKNPIHKLPFIAIIGKPNVGKSSLFNRIIGKKVAIISKEAGTTRDRVFRHTKFGDYQSILVDTGGIEFEKKESLEADMQSQARVAINDADVIVFLVDGRKDPTIDDFETAKILRRASKKMLLVANKIDHVKSAHNLLSWTELGFGEPMSISVIHNKGIDKLENTIAKQLQESEWPINVERESRSDTTKLSFIGRPNAGKSSLINALLGEKRVIVSDIPGTTRDAIDTDLDWESKHFTLIDTAGLRRRGKIERGIEKYSSFRTINAIERSDIVCLVLDYTIGIRAQDLHICSYVLEANKGLILLVNKSDLMEEKEAERNRIGRVLKHRFSFLSWAPVLFVSAKNRKNLELILETSIQINSERNKEIDHELLVDFLKENFHKHMPPTAGRKKLLFYDVIQIPSPTPTFEFMVNNRDIVHFSYRRYLENELREQFGYNGTALRFFFKNLDKKLLKRAKPL
jgi:GTPase